MAMKLIEEPVSNNALAGCPLIEASIMEDCKQFGALARSTWVVIFGGIVQEVFSSSCCDWYDIL